MHLILLWWSWWACKIEFFMFKLYSIDSIKLVSLMKFFDEFTALNSNFLVRTFMVFYVKVSLILSNNSRIIYTRSIIFTWTHWFAKFVNCWWKLFWWKIEQRNRPSIKPLKLFFSYHLDCYYFDASLKMLFFFIYYPCRHEGLSINQFIMLEESVLHTKLKTHRRAVEKKLESMTSLA